MTSNPRRALDRWAHDHADCASFDVYASTGGSLLAARQDIERRIGRLTDALQALRAYGQPYRKREPSAVRDDRQWVEEEGYPGSLVPSSHVGSANQISGATVGPEALARLEAEQHGEPVDPDNAHAQGADHAE